MKNYIKILFLGVVFIIFISCSATKSSISSYINPTYNKGEIQSIAILPIKNARFAPSEARDLNRKLIQILSTKNPNIKIVPPLKVIRIISKNNISNEWANFLNDYYTSGLLDKKTLIKISNFLKVDAIFQGNLIQVNQIDGGGFGSNTKGKSTVKMNFSIINCNKANILWEAKITGVKGNRNVVSDAPPINEAIDMAINKVKENMPIL